MGSSPLLLIDIGNTAVKLRRSRPDTLTGATRRLPTAALLPGRGGKAALASALEGWRYERVVFCSVVPEATRSLLTALPAGVPVLEVCPRLRGLGRVDLSAYPQRRTLGPDRLANMAGALALYGADRPMIVVDFGTAATFNVLAKGGRFLGGVIAPGLGGAGFYLAAKTARLPVLGRLRVPRTAIGKSTRAAMMAGAVFGYRGLVREIIAALRKEAPGARVIATGGDARFVAGMLPGLIGVVEPDLTFHGLRAIGGEVDLEQC